MEKKAKELIEAIENNTLDGEVEFSNGKEKMPVVPLQYISEELDELKREVENGQRK